MDDRFFKKPILNSPYEYPLRHWELDETGQPTQRIMEYRRSAQFITPIPKPRKRRRSAQQIEMVLDEGRALSTSDQQYDLTSTINAILGDPYVMDHKRGKISECSIWTDQGYRTLINLTRHSAVEALMRPFVIVEGEIAPEPIFHMRSSPWHSLAGPQ